jgi:cytochrome bd ubiquinol oxidase subunit II
MDLTALLLPRIQFGSTVAFHIFPSFTVGLAAWLTVLEAMHLWTGRPVYGLVFEFWVKIFAAAFGTLAISFWPYMIPFSITIEEAASPHSSLAFMFWGEGLFVFPLMLVYTVIMYSVFRSKVKPTAGHY